MLQPLVAVLAGVLLAIATLKLRARLRLSRAKHPSLGGHIRLSRRLARFIPFYEYDAENALSCDGADGEIVDRRRAAFARLSAELRDKSRATLAASEALKPYVSDMQFTDANRVPFQFRTLVREHLPLGAMSQASDGVRIQDLDGNWAYDVAGSYGVNLLGNDTYKDTIERGVARARELGPVLGPYHPLVAENVELIRRISGLDEVSFHMSGTEAVMQAVRLARFNSGRRQLVTLCGAYHGWWDGVQGLGHGRSVDDIFMLKDMSDATLRVLDTRRDIACVLVNPLQALHPNRGASSDAMLVDSGRSANFDRDAYSRWLHELRKVCSRRGIALIFDEVFVGFRLGLGGAQAYFGVDADMVTYGKTIGGGLPVGVLAGRSDWMRRYRPERPADLCFARGTFNSHPYVMASMNEFLRLVTLDDWATAACEQLDRWDRRAAVLNDELKAGKLPVEVHNMASVWMLTYTAPGRYNWLLQYYLRAEGLAMSWVGTGRLIFSHDYTDADFDAVRERIVRAVKRMSDDGWWSSAEGTTNASIRRQVLVEILKRRFGLSAGSPVAAGGKSVSDRKQPSAG